VCAVYPEPLQFIPTAGREPYPPPECLSVQVPGESFALPLARLRPPAAPYRPHLRTSYSYNERLSDLKTVAYSTLLASVADDQVISFQEGGRSMLEADLSIRCSHLLTSWVRPNDLRHLLRQAIDGGQSLRADLWHPFRAPAWHPSKAAIEIESRLRTVWNERLEKFGPLDPRDWYGVEIAKVLKVFGHAAASQNSVVSFLEPPSDGARAEKVSIPVIDRPTDDPST
jgi:hypothetical protein